MCPYQIPLIEWDDKYQTIFAKSHQKLSCTSTEIKKEKERNKTSCVMLELVSLIQSETLLKCITTTLGSLPLPLLSHLHSLLPLTPREEKMSWRNAQCNADHCGTIARIHRLVQVAFIPSHGLERQILEMPGVWSYFPIYCHSAVCQIFTGILVDRLVIFAISLGTTGGFMFPKCR